MTDSKDHALLQIITLLRQPGLSADDVAALKASPIASGVTGDSEQGRIKVDIIPDSGLNENSVTEWMRPALAQPSVISPPPRSPGQHAFKPDVTDYYTYTLDTNIVLTFGFNRTKASSLVYIMRKPKD